MTRRGMFHCAFALTLMMTSVGCRTAPQPVPKYGSNTAVGQTFIKVRAPALAIYAETFLDVRNGDSAQLAKNLAWEQTHMAPFRAASMERARRGLSNVQIVSAPGTHLDFIYTSREQVVAAMQRFLGGSPPQN